MGVLGRIVFGVLTLVPGAGLFHLVGSVVPRVQSGEISWMHFLAVTTLIVTASFASLAGLIVHAVRNPSLRDRERAAWVAGLFFMFPVIGPIYRLTASIRDAGPRAAAS